MSSSMPIYPDERLSAAHRYIDSMIVPPSFIPYHFGVAHRGEFYIWNGSSVCWDPKHPIPEPSISEDFAPTPTASNKPPAPSSIVVKSPSFVACDPVINLTSVFDNDPDEDAPPSQPVKNKGGRPKKILYVKNSSSDVVTTTDVRKNFGWSTEKTHLLIVCWRGFALGLKTAYTKKKSVWYERIRARLADEFNVHAEVKNIICRIKFLQKTYKRIKDELGDSGNEEDVTWEYFEAVDSVMRTLENVRPKHIGCSREARAIPVQVTEDEITPKVKVQQDTQLKENILRLSQELLDSIGKFDWARYEQLTDSSLTGFEPEAKGCLVQGLPFHHFYFANRPPSFARPHLNNMASPHVRILCETAAIVSYLLVIQMTDKNGEISTVSSEETRVWQLKDGAWKQVHFHRSKPST